MRTRKFDKLNAFCPIFAPIKDLEFDFVLKKTRGGDMARRRKTSSDPETRLAQINDEILALEEERDALLAEELENAQARVDEIQAALSGAAAPKRRRATKKRAGKRGRPAKKKRAARKGAPKKRRPRGNNAERLGTVKKLVKGAGKDGISARQVAKESGFPYQAVLKILNSGEDFNKVGEKRDRRYFVK